MSPFTRPFSSTFGTCTSPSMAPLSLTESVESRASSERTLPRTCPSRCRPPWNSTSPCTRAALPISVSMRACRGSRVNIALAPIEWGHRLWRCLDGPQERLRERRHIVAARLYLHHELLGLESERHRELLVEVLQVTEVIPQFAHAAATQRGEVQRARAAVSGACETQMD